MKQLIKLTLGILLPLATLGQSLKENSYVFRGPVEPLINTYSDAKTLSVKLSLPSDFETVMHKYNASVPASTLELELLRSTFFHDIKKIESTGSYNSSVFSSTANVNKPVESLPTIDEADLKVYYDVKQFEILDTKTILKAPAWVIGIETSLEIKNNTGETIYSRVTPITVKTYLTNPTGVTLDNLTSEIINWNFSAMFNEFAFAFLRQPVSAFYTNYFELPKKDKNLEVDKTFIETFNQSAAVFDAIEKVDKSKYNTLFEKARPFWEANTKFEDSKSKDIKADIKYAANVNLAISYLLVNQEEKAAAYFPAIKENKPSGFFSKNRLSDLEDWYKAIKETKQIKEVKASHFEAIKNMDSNLLFSLSENTIKKLSFNGKIIDQKGEQFEGKIEILNDNPPLIDLRTVDTGSGIGNLMKGLKSEKNTVLVNIEGEKKPKRVKMDDLKFLILSDGTSLNVNRVGELIGGTDRYAILRETKKGEGISLFVEDYPYSGTVLLKKNNEEEFFEVPNVISRKKALSKYFEGCPNIQPNIESGKYLNNANSTYLMIFEDYQKMCK